MSECLCGYCEICAGSFKGKACPRCGDIGIAAQWCECEKERAMSEYILTIKVDQTWLDILGQISRNQDGFIWIKIKERESESNV